ncbi:MAG TPA: Gfo/Idh/MocA family oxidoreductase [Chthonomonadales bacterium]|nr:Gfo/Idh/MocA family oxidoreductase [Chthonomonadales bacterium]
MADVRPPSRREALAAGLSAAAGLTLGSAARAQSVPPGERLGIGLIGAGNIAGAHFWPSLSYPDVRVVGVCDVHEGRMQAMVDVANRHYGSTVCRGHRDFRELLARPDVDAVFVCTPDHWHAIQVIAAARAGKHIYAEKPLSLTFAEGRAMVEAVRRHGVCFQHGTQQRSAPEFRRAAELVRNGRAGKIHTVRVAVSGGRESGWGRPKPPPPHIDWDLWLGPAPQAPYSDERFDTQHWYFIQDYSAGGFISGWGVHHVDSAQWGLGKDLTGPMEIEGRAVFPTDGMCDTPITWHVQYTYPGVRVIFTSDNEQRFGVRFEGDRGQVFVNRGEFVTLPASIGRERIGPDETLLYRSDNHHRNWIECIRSGRDPVAPVEVAHRSQTICILSDIAIRLGRKVRWDAARERIVGDPAASQMLARSMRSPWRL